jgi:hypothetical protein
MISEGKYGIYLKNFFIRTARLGEKNRKPSLMEVRYEIKKLTKHSLNFFENKCIGKKKNALYFSISLFKCREKGRVFMAGYRYALLCAT